MNKMKISEAFVPKDIYSTEASKNGIINLYCKDSRLKDSDKNTGVTTQEINGMQSFSSQQNTAATEIIDWDLNKLIDYISDAHQSIRKNAVRIYDLAQKLVYCHSDNHPEMTEFTTAIFFFLHDLLNYMMREEQILFPNIRQLSKDNKGSKTGKYSTFGLIKEWARHTQKEHLSACTSLKLLSQLPNNYSIPPDACNSYKSLFRRMQEFEASFLLPMNIENNILFPKALVEDGEPR